MTRQATLRMRWTCVGIRTGSALKKGRLQRDGLKAVLAPGVVFDRACGAASTTLADENTIGQIFFKNHRQIKKKTFKTYKTGLRATPPVAKCRKTKQQRNSKDSPSEPRALRGEHENAKETPQDPKGHQKTTGGLPKIFKKVPKSNKNWKRKKG